MEQLHYQTLNHWYYVT